MLSELFIIIFTLLWVFQQFEFHEDCRFSLLYVILSNVSQKLSHLLLHTPKSQLKESQQLIEEGLEKKYLQDFLFLRKSIFKKRNVSLKYIYAHIYHENFPSEPLIHV